VTGAKRPNWECFRAASALLQQFGPVDDHRQTVLVGLVRANTIEKRGIWSAGSHGEPLLGSGSMLEEQPLFPDFELRSGADLRLEYLIVGAVK